MAATLENRNIDYPLLIVTICLVALGLTMVYSSSAMFAKDKFGTADYFLIREIIFCILGGGALVIARLIPIEFYQRGVYVIYIGAAFWIDDCPRVGRKRSWQRNGDGRDGIFYAFRGRYTLELLSEWDFDVVTAALYVNYFGGLSAPSHPFFFKSLGLSKRNRFSDYSIVCGLSCGWFVWAGPG